MSMIIYDIFLLLVLFRLLHSPFLWSFVAILLDGTIASLTYKHGVAVAETRHKRAAPLGRLQAQSWS